MVQMNRFAGQKLRHRCREQTYGHQGGKAAGVGGGGAMNRAIGIDMYTLVCIKLMTNKDLLYKKINKIKFKNFKKNVTGQTKQKQKRILRSVWKDRRRARRVLLGRNISRRREQSIVSKARRMLKIQAGRFALVIWGSLEASLEQFQWRAPDGHQIGVG